MIVPLKYILKGILTDRQIQRLFSRDAPFLIWAIGGLRRSFMKRDVVLHSGGDGSHAPTMRVLPDGQKTPSTFQSRGCFFRPWRPIARPAFVLRRCFLCPEGPSGNLKIQMSFGSLFYYRFRQKCMLVQRNSTEAISEIAQGTLIV
jgi:hypothetical protein